MAKTKKPRKPITTPDGQLDTEAAKDLIADTLSPPEPEPDPAQASGTQPAPDGQGAQATAASAPELAPDADAPADWRTAPEIIETAADLELTAAEMTAFNDETEFRRVAQILDRQRRAEGRRLRETEEAPTGQPPPDATPTTATTPATTTTTATGQDQLIARLAAIEDRLRRDDETRAAEQHARTVEQFERHVDDLGYETLLGKGQAVSNDQRAVRERIWEALTDLLHAAQSRGRPAAISAQLVRRAFNQECAEERIQHERQQLTADIQRQAAETLGSPSSRTPGRPVYTGPLEKHPDLIAAHRRMQEENGSRA
jgi:hypothetical protein